MGAPAALLGDQITGACPIHQLIGPIGVPMPTPGLPFMAPLLLGCSTQTMINGKPVALVGASGMNTPPHVGLHASDPYMAPPLQVGTVMASPALTMIEGRPVATTGASCTMCANMPGMLVGTADVMVG
jgi:uncharacterized Zn-binding protein involved in type VI secretion